MKKARQVYVHNVTLIGITQTRSFIIYAFVSLATVAYFMNYSIILEKVFALIRNVIGSVTASVGHLIAEGNIDKVYSVYKELYSAVVFVAGIATVGIYSLSNDLITLWLGHKYVLGAITLLPFYVHFYFDINNDITRSFVNGFGLFRDIWAPIAELIIYLAVAILGGYLWGLFGVLLGRLVATLVIWYIWKPYFLFHSGLKMSVRRYWAIFLPLMLCQIVLAYICVEIVDGIEYFNNITVISFLLKAIFTLSFFSVSTFIAFCVMSSGFRNFVMVRMLKKSIKTNICS